jgi:putative protease
MQSDSDIIPSNPELLAPAGSPEAGYAALQYGADAVYLALQKFSARADAVNFTKQELSSFVSYAHSMNPGRKVYLALNTLVMEKELPEAIDSIMAACSANVDAIIVQDFGVLRLIKKYFPEIKIHASTQMAIHNTAGALSAKSAGCARVTLARELTLEEIKHIKEVSKMEIECFVHGALCYSYSGLCLFSSMLLGRSGNRGRCAYLCREAFSFSSFKEERKFFPFSMKDLALYKDISLLKNAGVNALKIEGRMKSPLYVATTVAFYRKLIDGNISEKEIEDMLNNIRSVFSRKWTELYIKNSTQSDFVDNDFSGHRGARTGEISKIVRHNSNQWIRFNTLLNLEIHDGLQYELPEKGSFFGFPILKMRSLIKKGKQELWKDVFKAKKGDCVEIMLPQDAELIRTGSAIFRSSSQEVKGRYKILKPNPKSVAPKIPLDFDITFSASGITVKVKAFLKNGSFLEEEQSFNASFSKAVQRDEVLNTVKEVFARLGNTEFVCRTIKLNNPEKLFVPISFLNESRRIICQQLAVRIQTYFEHTKREILDKAMQSTNRLDKCCPINLQPPMWLLQINDFATLSLFEAKDFEKAAEIIVGGNLAENQCFLKKSGLFDAVSGKIRIALPVILRGNEEELTGTVKSLLSEGNCKWQISNIYGFNLLLELARNLKIDIDVSADWQLYAFNSQAIQFLLEAGIKRVALSPEDTFENTVQLMKHFGDFVEIIIFQNTPLMISETCPFKNANRCNHEKCIGLYCKREEHITSCFKDKLILLQQNGKTLLFNSKPYSLMPYRKRLEESGAVWFRIDFSYGKYTANEALKLWRAIIENTFSFPFYTGNFEKNLL